MQQACKFRSQIRASGLDAALKGDEACYIRSLVLSRDGPFILRLGVKAEDEG